MSQQPKAPRPKDATERPEEELSLARPVKDENQDSPLPKRIDVRLFRRLFEWTHKYRLKRNLLLGSVILRSIQMPTLAWAIGAIIDGPITNNDHKGTIVAAVGFLLFAIFTQVTMHFRQRWALELGEAVVRDMRTSLFEHLMRQPMSYFNRVKVGSIISRCTSDIENVRVGVQNVVFVALVQLGQMLISGVLMAYYNWILFLIILGMAPVLVLINRHFRTKITDSSRALQESFSRVTATLVESVKGIRVTQGFARERINADLFRQLAFDHSAYNLGLARNIAIFLPLLELNSQIFIAVTLLVGGFGALHPDINMPVGDLIMFLFLANLFFEPIKVIGRIFTVALSAMAGAERVFSVLDSKPDWTDPEDARPLPPINGSVEFRNITFGYKPAEPVLKDISFSVEKGQSIALVGHTGSGKSTIIGLLCKFYLPQQGEILFDGHPISRATTLSVRSHIGLVLQQNYLFSGTVMDNIRLGKLGASDQAVIEAVKKLDCLDIIEAMPNGFQTLLGEKGSGISLGQQQIVCFARAMLADPQILVLDEATSSVDTVTEARLQTALEKLLSGRTSFIVAHRLSTIRKADQVLVLDHGKIIEHGSHNQLLEKGGAYTSLYRKFVEG